MVDQLNRGNCTGYENMNSNFQNDNLNNSMAFDDAMNNSNMRAVKVVENASDSFYLSYLNKKTIITLCVIIMILIGSIASIKVRCQKEIEAIQIEYGIDQTEDNN